MTSHRAFVATFAGLALVGTSIAALPQPAPNAAAVPYVLTMGDMMEDLIQPRHAKLGLAGRAENWPLAAYAVAELRQTFANIGKAQPKFHGMPVPELLDAATTQALNALDAAIKQQDPKMFATAYDQLNQGCNACHTTTDHPFVVIKSPDASSFPSQNFNTR